MMIEPIAPVAYAELTHQPADRTESCVRIVGQTSCCDQGCRPVGATGEHARTNHREPRSGDDQAGHRHEYADEVADDLPGNGGWASVGSEVGELGDAGERYQQPPCLWRRGGHASSDAEWRDDYASQREASCDCRGDGHSDCHHDDVEQRRSEVGGVKGCARKGNRGHRGPDQIEDTEPEHRPEARQRSSTRRPRSPRPAGRGADEPHRGEALLAPRCRQAGWPRR